MSLDLRDKRVPLIEAQLLGSKRKEKNEEFYFCKHLIDSFYGAAVTKPRFTGQKLI